MKISKNTVLITGGGSGIGLALTKAFTLADNTVIIVGRDMNKLQLAKIKMPELHIFKADISKELDRNRLINQLQEKFHDINILINNAATAHFSDLRQNTGVYENSVEEIQTNYLAPLHLSQLLLPKLMKRESSAIINITSLSVLYPMVSMPGYSASKSALHTYSQMLRSSLSKTSVKVFEILPPPVDTNLVSKFNMAKMTPEDLAKQVLKGIEKNTYEMSIGLKVKMLRWFMRIAPAFAQRISNRVLMKAVS